MNRLKRNTSNWSRWLHIYLSMFSFIILLFFAVTGITLNHTEWFADQQTTKNIKGIIKANWVTIKDTAKIPKLDIVEYLRNTHAIKGAVGEFSIDDYQCAISFNGAGYTADVFINRGDASYEVIETRTGIWGVLNDLHKGRDAGKTWAWLIDASAVLMVLVSMTGLIMLFFLKKKRVSGILIMVLGGLICYLVYRIFVP
ncbi:MAG: hypothetical protein RLZZ45_1197 [Bacteroidota bacterium]